MSRVSSSLSPVTSTRSRHRSTNIVVEPTGRPRRRRPGLRSGPRRPRRRPTRRSRRRPGTRSDRRARAGRARCPSRSPASRRTARTLSVGGPSERAPQRASSRMAGRSAAPVVGELVDLRGGRRREGTPGHDPGGLEVAQARGEDVRPDAGQAVDQVGVALGPVHQLADHEQRPAIPDQVERVGHRAVLVVVLAHARNRTTHLMDVEENTCKIEVDAVTVVAHDFEHEKGTTSGVHRPPQVAGPRAPLRRPVHGRPRHRDRERRAAVHPDRPRLLAGEPPVGDQRLRPRLRRLPAARRPGRRHARPSPPLPRGDRRVHRRLAAGRAGLVGGLADRGPGAAGPRRGDHHAGRPVDPLDDVRRRA